MMTKENKVTNKIVLILFATCSLLICNFTVNADPVTIPNTFINGEKLTAADLNDNNTAIITALTLISCYSNGVIYGGRCYYLDGSGGVCAEGFELAPQSILTTISNRFMSKYYLSTQSDSCCIAHADQDTEFKDWGMQGADCNIDNPFGLGPALGGNGCTNIASANSPNQLTLCVNTL